MKNDIPGSESPSAIILQFPRRRGRPRAIRPKSDTGTPELIMRRLRGETAEALDLCLERGLITQEQHWCGIHLRWLYTLRFGAPNVRAIDPAHLGGRVTNNDDPEWRAAREAEYHEAMKELMQKGGASLLVNLCIHNERPSFLTLHRNASPARRETALHSIDNIRDALDVLVRVWHRGSGKR